MTSSRDGRVSLYDKFSSTLAGKLSLAAADSALSVIDLLHAAKSRSGLTSREIASRLNVTEGRISQILNGDGNLHVATIARFLGACGYRFSVEAIPQSDRARELPRRRRRRRSHHASTVWQVENTYATLTGVTRTRHYIESLGDAPVALTSAITAATNSPSGYSIGDSTKSWPDQARDALRTEGAHSKVRA